MTGRAKGRLALLGLALVLVGFVVALATTRAARVHFLAWRMRSSDREVRLAARTRLMEIGRPAIDAVFPDLVAGEVCDRLDEVPPSERVVFVSRPTRHHYLLSTDGWPWTETLEVERPLGRSQDSPASVTHGRALRDALADSLEHSVHGEDRTLVVGRAASGMDSVMALLFVQLSVNDDLAPWVIEATRVRLGELK